MQPKTNFPNSGNAGSCGNAAKNRVPEFVEPFGPTIQQDCSQSRSSEFVGSFWIHRMLQERCQKQVPQNIPGVQPRIDFATWGSRFKIFEIAKSPQAFRISAGMQPKQISRIPGIALVSKPCRCTAKRESPKSGNRFSSQGLAGIKPKMHPKAAQRMRVRVFTAMHRSCDKKQKDVEGQTLRQQCMA